MAAALAKWNVAAICGFAYGRWLDVSNRKLGGVKAVFTELKASLQIVLLVLQLLLQLLLPLL